MEELKIGNVLETVGEGEATYIQNKQVEKVARALHKTWIGWTKFLCNDPYYDIPTHIRNFWAKNWVDFDELPTYEQEKDRVAAREFLGFLEE